MLVGVTSCIDIKIKVPKLLLFRLTRVDMGSELRRRVDWSACGGNQPALLFESGLACGTSHLPQASATNVPNKDPEGLEQISTGR